jgi:hypothetical protein
MTEKRTPQYKAQKTPCKLRFARRFLFNTIIKNIFFKKNVKV